MRRRRHGRRLHSRIFLWLLGAIVTAVIASGLMFHLTRSDAGETPARVVSTTVARRLGRMWDDRAACDRYVAQLREDIGLEVTLLRDPTEVPESIQRRPHRSMAFDASGYGYVPVLREGRLVGALRFETGSGPPRPGGILVALAAALLVLAVAARMVSRQLARPLEDVALAAERFGEGNLGVRTDVAGRKHWVADEVRNLAQAFDRMADRIETIVRDQRELLGAISHELRSPLGRARVALEIARERGEGNSGNLDRIEKELGSVDAILGDLLAATRAGLSDLRREEVPLATWLRERLAAEVTPPAIELDAPGDPRASVDSALLGRAVHNLLENARVHGHPKEQALAVRLEVVGAVARVIVRDRGPGFPASMIDRAFEPFVRGDVARRPTGGTGLGLALVRRIAEAHGGRAAARNVEGGAEVLIEVPLSAG